MVDDDKRPNSSGQSDAEPAPRSSFTSEGLCSGVNAPQSTINAQDVIAGSKYVYYGRSDGSRWNPSPPISRYLKWLAAQEHEIPMRGVGRGELTLTLKQTYVSLGLAVTPKDRATKGGRERHSVATDSLSFELGSLFAKLSEERAMHTLLLGEPGSGKSTALRKLGQLVAEQARRAQGEELPTAQGPDGALLGGSLGERYLPVFVRLREWRDDDSERSLKEFIRRELLETAQLAEEKGAPPLDDEVIDALWEHGELVLMLDGLDEVTAPKRRKELSKSLASQLDVPAHGGLRVVLSCRYAAYDEAEMELGVRGFCRADLQPLSKEQAELLIRRWFEEVARTDAEHLPRKRALRLAEGLTQALEHPSLHDYRRAMFATPLIVTLLCVLYLRGKELPHSRAELYELCLEVLLGSWHKGKDASAEAADLDARADDAPLTPRQATLLLRPLAYRLHTTQDADRPERSEQIERELLLAMLMDGLEEQGLHLDEEAALMWLHERAAVLDELAPSFFGFFHLGIQEYLAAREVASRGEAALQQLAARIGDSWWREVILIAASLDRSSFAPLMEGLLESADLLDPKQWRRVRECVVEGNFDPQPFIARFTAKSLATGERLVAILRLLEGRERLPQRLVAVLESLAGQEGVDEEARGRAAQLVANVTQSAAGTLTYDIAVVCLDDACSAADQLLRKLRPDKSLRVWPDEGVSPSLSGIDAGALRKMVKAVVVVIANRLPWAATQILVAKLQRLTRHLGFTALCAPGSSARDPRATIPPGWRLKEVLDMRAGWDASALKDRRWLGQAVTEVSPVANLIARRRTPSIEPTTGIRLLWVPRGIFMMGSESDDDSSPSHLVSVKPFWIGETPVTNQQYRAFVEATGHREPRAWRQRGFNDPQQPVVTVGWGDAEAFCRWLSEQSGWSVNLPSEAQWEFAARGEEGRPFPWGVEHPDATRAHFSQGDGGRPAIVGSYPAGAGPFGTLDQAGNVWEWCKDRWNDNAYKDRSRPPSVSTELDVLGAGDEAIRSMRGGSWTHSSRSALAAAFRGRGWLIDADGYDDVGFRVVAVPEPLAQKLARRGSHERDVDLPWDPPTRDVQEHGGEGAGPIGSTWGADSSS